MQLEGFKGFENGRKSFPFRILHINIFSAFLELVYNKTLFECCKNICLKAIPIVAKSKTVPQV